MVQQLTTAFAALSEDMGLIPQASSHLSIILVFPGIRCLLLAVMGTRYVHSTHIHMQAKHLCTGNKNKIFKLILFVCVHCTYRGQRTTLLPCGSQGLNSSHNQISWKAHCIFWAT